MAEKERGLVGAEFKLALELERRNLRLAGAHHVEGDQPFVQRDFRVLHNGAYRHGEGVMAVAALVEAGPRAGLLVGGADVDFLRETAVRADRAVGPAGALEVVRAASSVEKRRMISSKVSSSSLAMPPYTTLDL